MTLSAQWLTKIKGSPVLPSLPPWLSMPGGRQVHVAPVSGQDFGRTGKSPDNSIATLHHALGLATDDQDIIILHGEGNAASQCTLYQTSTLEWNKDCVHLIGQNRRPISSPSAEAPATSRASSSMRAWRGRFQRAR